MISATGSEGMDHIDRAILRELSKDARLSIQALAERVNLSPSPVSRRLRALEKSGAIMGYHALLDERQTGFAVSVFVSVRLDRQTDNAIAKFEAAVQSFPEVVDCWLMTGNRDYLLRVACSDLLAFEQFLTRGLTRIPGVAAIESSIPLRRVKAGVSRSV